MTGRDVAVPCRQVRLALRQEGTAACHTVRFPQPPGVAEKERVKSHDSRVRSRIEPSTSEYKSCSLPLN